MTRRLVVSLVGTAAAALLVVGVATLLLARVGARDEARHQLEEQVGGLADFGREIRAPANTFNQLRRLLDLDGLEFLVVRRDGGFQGELPAGVERADLDLGRLRAGEVLSGERGGRVWAAAGVRLGARTPLVVLTRRVDPFLGSAARWFTVAACLTLVLAALAAALLARRLTRRLRATEAATRRLAAGDLSARVPVPRHRDEIADLGASVNTMAAALERAQGAERSFLLSVSHDLRTPLTAIRGWAEALADGAVEDAAGAGRVLENQARRLERLVADLLDLAHLRAGRFSLERAPVDLTAVAQDVAGAARPAAVAAGVEVGHPASPDGAPVVALADGGRVAQVLANLLDNAIRHAASTVSLTVEDGRGACRLVIDDDGPGIPAEERDLVFERFWSGGGRNDRTATSGLGLTIAAELCSAMGGRATVADSPLGGARFVIELPSGASLVATLGGALDPA